MIWLHPTCSSTSQSHGIIRSTSGLWYYDCTSRLPLSSLTCSFFPFISLLSLKSRDRRTLSGRMLWWVWCVLQRLFSALENAQKWVEDILLENSFWLGDNQNAGGSTFEQNKPLIRYSARKSGRHRQLVMHETAGDSQMFLAVRCWRGKTSRFGLVRMRRLCYVMQNRASITLLHLRISAPCFSALCIICRYLYTWYQSPKSAWIF